MYAVIKTASGVGQIEYRSIPEPVPGPNQVKIRVEAAGICGTDIHIYYDEFPSYPPVVLGHEFSGVIVECGSAVKAFRAGDRVTAELPVAACGVCRYCRSGHINLCPARRGLGWSANGSFAEYLVVDESSLHLLPDTISFEEGALCEPLAVCCHAVAEVARVRPGDIVLVTGPGPIGLLASQVARAHGAYVVLCGVTADTQRLALGAALGADRAVNVEEEDVVAIARELGDGLGVDIVFECSGAAGAAISAIEALRKQGEYIQLGLFGRPVQLPLDAVVTKEIRIRGVFSSNWRAWHRALRLIEQRRVQLLPVISHRLPLEQWKLGFDLISKREALKVILIPPH